MITLHRTKRGIKYHKTYYRTLGDIDINGKILPKDSIVTQDFRLGFNMYELPKGYRGLAIHDCWQYRFWKIDKEFVEKA